MSINLLESINEYISGDVISNLSGFLGESPKNTTSALSNAIPSLLAGLVSKGADNQGANALLGLLNQGGHDGGLLDNLAAAFAGGESTSNLLSSGGALLSSIFGQKSEGITNLIANASGISKSSSGSLLGLLAPLVMGVLGKSVKSQGITSAAGLASLLASQSGMIKNFLPAGLSGILGLAGMADLGKPSAAVAATHVIEDESGGFGKFLPWLLLPAILALGWGLLKYFQLPKVTTPDTTISQTVTPASDANLTTPIASSAPAPTPAESAAEVSTAEAVATPSPTPAPVVEDKTASNPAAALVDGVAKIGEVFEKTLSSGFAIKASKDGIENKLIGFLEDSTRQVDKTTWFTMDGIVFDTAKATIKPDSKAQITNIVEIMKAFPQVKIKIGGYTDNKGNAKSNLKLSADRAKAVKAALAKAGVAAARIETEGYGDANPVATNDTDAGRQQNRRIDVRVTAK